MRNNLPALRKKNLLQLDVLFRSMRDKSERTDENRLYPRRLVNIETDSNSASPRPGLKLLFDVGKPILKTHKFKQGSELDFYIFTKDEVFKSTGSKNNFRKAVSIGTYPETDFIDTADYIRKTKSLKTGTVKESKENFVTVDGILTKEEYTGKIIQFKKGGLTEEISVAYNTENAIQIDGYLENAYNGTSFEIFDTDRCVYFTANGTLYRIADGKVENTLKQFDYIQEYSGRLFGCQREGRKFIFSNSQTLYYPKQQQAIFNKGDGDFLGLTRAGEYLIIITERGIYRIMGQLPEEMIPSSILSESVFISGPDSFVSTGAILYLLSNRGLEKVNLGYDTKQTNVVPITHNLTEDRFDRDKIGKRPIVRHYDNKIFVQMKDYILVHDILMSGERQNSWFGEYRGFVMDDLEEDGVNGYIAEGTKFYYLDKKKTTDDNRSGILPAPVVAEVEFNASRYAQRDMEKLWQDFAVYFSWYDKKDAEVTFSWEGMSTEIFEKKWTTPSEEVVFRIDMYSPYLNWNMKIKGGFKMESLLIFFRPNVNMFVRANK